jgi:hypothetical protein
MEIYSDRGTVIGATRRSPCGCTQEAVIVREPWRTQLVNMCDDYALTPPYEGGAWRLVEDAGGSGPDQAPRWELWAKSLLEEGLWVPVAELVEDEAGRAVLGLLRVRPRYAGRRPRRKRHG